MCYDETYCIKDNLECKNVNDDIFPPKCKKYHCQLDEDLDSETGEVYFVHCELCLKDAENDPNR